MLGKTLECCGDLVPQDEHFKCFIDREELLSLFLCDASRDLLRRTNGVSGNNSELCTFERTSIRRPHVKILPVNDIVKVTGLRNSEFLTS